jgi:hypothetical protein
VYVTELLIIFDTLYYNLAKNEVSMMGRVQSFVTKVDWLFMLDTDPVSVLYLVHTLNRELALSRSSRD